MRTPLLCFALSPVLLAAACVPIPPVPSDKINCVEDDITHEVPVNQYEGTHNLGTQLSFWSIIRTLDSDDDGVSLLLERPTEKKAKILAFLGPDGKIVEVAKVANTTRKRFSAGPAWIRGHRCVAYSVDGESLKLACEDGKMEDSQFFVKTSVHGPGMLTSIAKEGSLVVFTTTTAGAFTAVDRNYLGKWHEDRELQTPESWPESQQMHFRQPNVCYISDAGHAVFIDKDKFITSVALTTSCKIAGDDTSMHILIDQGFTSFPWANMDGNLNRHFGVTPMELDHVLALVTNWKEPFVVRLNTEEKKLQRIRLETGDVTDLTDATDNEGSYHAEFRGGKLLVSSSPTVHITADPPVQSLRIITYCTSKW